jgi:hypothetical protein
MKFTRKEFLSGLALGMAGAVLRPMSALGAAAGNPLEPQQFKALVGKTFHVFTADSRGSIDIVLDAYNELPASAKAHQFSLTFVAPGGEKLTEGTYSVEQDQMGRFQIFVVPTRRDGQGRTFYRADFNLLTNK